MVTTEELEIFTKAMQPKPNRKQRRARNIDRTFSKKGYRNGVKIRKKR